MNNLKIEDLCPTFDPLVSDDCREVARKLAKFVIENCHSDTLRLGLKASEALTNFAANLDDPDVNGHGKDKNN